MFDVLWDMKRYDELLPTIEPLLKFKRPEALIRLGRMYAKGYGVPQDYEKAKEAMYQAANKDSFYKAEYGRLLKKASAGE